MFMDVTAILMGDPAAQYRRAPTLHEMKTQHASEVDLKIRRGAYGTQVRGARSRLLAPLKPGQAVQAHSYYQAKNYIAWFRAQGLVASLKRNADRVTYTVTRVR